MREETFGVGRRSGRSRGDASARRATTERAGTIGPSIAGVGEGGGIAGVRRQGGRHLREPLAGFLTSPFSVLGAPGALNDAFDVSIVGLAPGSLLQPPNGVIRAQPTSPTVARRNSLRDIKSPPEWAGNMAGG